MKHVLLTRFALRFPEGASRQYFEKNPKWLDHRMNLFRKYCLPSVKKQTYKDFDWYLIIDPSFRNIDSVLDELKGYAKILHTSDLWKEKQPEIGEKLVDGYEEWLCTTRLDSDDIISPEFMYILSENVCDENMWVNFPYGYLLDTTTNKTYEAKYEYNPFLSYVENVEEECKSVFHLHHQKIYKEGINIKSIDNYRGWTQVVHSSNIKNTVANAIRHKRIKS